MITTHKLIFGILVLLASVCSYANNNVSVTFVNQVNAFAISDKTNPMFFVGTQSIISTSSFSPQKATIFMPYSGGAQLLIPGVNYYDPVGPAGPGYYQLFCNNPGGFNTMIDTRYGGNATITLLSLATQPTLDLACSCTGTACGTNLKK